ncbi:MAG: low molecular weight phosphotyrosine protein phosphatase [Labilithrix sp.]|nr:low molecular weight phosphotyrosine protein phosphatase [Labilithrix sp.]
MLASRGVSAQKVRVCFVCSGNICRSPTAEGVFKKLVAEAGLAHAFDVESAGIGNWHVGERPDPRTLRAAETRGYRLESRAQQWKARDFDRFDYVVAMDRTHVHSLVRLATTETMKAKISLARAHVQGGPRDADVPDPYYGELEGFDEVVDICVEACTALLAGLRRKHGL